MSRMVRIISGHFGRVAILELEQPLVEHAHSASHLLFWLEGCMDLMTVGGQSVPFNCDNGVVVKSWEPHTVCVERKNQHCLFLLFYIDAAWLSKQCVELGYSPLFNSSTLKMTDTLKTQVQKIATSLISEQEDHIDIELYVTQLLEMVLHSLHTNSITNTFSSDSSAHIDFRIRKSIEYMQNHLDARLSFDDVARSAGISRPHFFSLFRKHMKMTPSVFWNTLRMENAINQLVSTNISLNDLAYDLGFTEPGNFSRFFRNHSGVAPSQYRSVGGGY